MANIIKYFHGTQAAFNKTTSIDSNALYFISDTERLYKGNTLIASNNVKYVTTMPAVVNAIEGMVYIHTETNKTSIKILNSTKDDYITLASSDSIITANSVTEFTNKTIDANNNTIENLTLAEFSASVISKSLPSYSDETGEVVDASDGKIMTEKAIAEALKDTIIDVEYTAPTDDKDGNKLGPVLVFTSKNGITKSINIPRDNFLSNAVLDETNKELVLTMVSGDVIKIPVQDLMISELDTDHIILSENVSVLGSNWGSWKNGNTMAKGITLTDILKKGVATQVPPNYTAPTIAIANDSGQAAGSVEAGTTVNVKLKSTFTKNDAGSLTGHQFYKNNTAVGTSVTTTPHTYTESVVVTDTTLTYKSTATYAAGAIKNDNLGDPYPSTAIGAGSKTSSNYSISGKRYGFYGASADEISADSATIRSLTKTKLNLAAGDVFNITVPIGAKYVLFAYPATLRTCNEIMYVETNDTGMKKNFTEESVNVADARGESNGLISYRVFKFEMAGPAEAVMTFKVTI